jgi:hypothetical protein
VLELIICQFDVSAACHWSCQRVPLRCSLAPINDSERSTIIPILAHRHCAVEGSAPGSLFVAMSGWIGGTFLIAVRKTVQVGDKYQEQDGDSVKDYETNLVLYLKIPEEAGSLTLLK